MKNKFKYHKPKNEVLKSLGKENVMMIGKRDYFVHMSQEENDTMWDSIMNDSHHLLFEPKTKRYGLSIKYKDEDIMIPLFKTWAEARTHGLGQNEVFKRTCTLDNGSKQIFYIPKATAQNISSLN